MILRDYHMHTNRCDAVATAEEMIRAAMDRGLEEVGISEHAYTSFDHTYCLSLQATEEYIEELKALREKYADRISIKIGLEMDRYSDYPADFPLGDIDYRIGSVHYVRIPAKGNVGGCSANGASDCLSESLTEPHPEGVFIQGGYVYIPIDESAKLQRAACERYFGGDMIALVECYFDTISEVIRATNCDMIGHFDLIAKFNEKEGLFDEGDPRYIAAWKKAADRLIPASVPFEINTGAISKGYRSQPYPSDPVRAYIREKGGCFILSSDSHRTDTLCFRFDKYRGEV